MVELVQEHHVATTHEPGDEAEVRLVARRKDEAGFLAEELRQLVLQALVQIEGAVQESAARATRPVALKRLLRGREHLRMMGEPQVVVGAHHDPLFAFDDDDGVFGVRNRPEIRVQADGLKLPGLGEALALVE